MKKCVTLIAVVTSLAVSSVGAFAQSASSTMFNIKNKTSSDFQVRDLKGQGTVIPAKVGDVTVHSNGQNFRAVDMGNYSGRECDVVFSTSGAVVVNTVNAPGAPEIVCKVGVKNSVYTITIIPNNFSSNN